MPARPPHGSPRFRSTLLVLAVLAMAFRSLVPTGFMIAAVDGRAELVMCPAGLHHGGHAHHLADAAHQGAGALHAAGLEHAADQCPFALAGSPGLTGAAPDLAQPYFVLLQPSRTVAVATVPAEPPPRRYAPRGPPALA
jgi:hypothetical protein